MGSIPDSAERDLEARSAIWRAICVASDDVRHRFRIKSICGVDGSPVRNGTGVPDVVTWQLVEALSLLAVVLRSEDSAADVVNVFGKTGPIEIQEEGIVRHLWAQQTLRGDKSALNGRPDLIVTSSREPPHSGNAIRIIEAKCHRQLGSITVRSEFGKAHDLRVATYLIWSFYSPTPRVVEGARRLGIDLEALGFDTDHRADLIERPDVLISRIAHAQEQSRRAQRFALALDEASQDARRKLLGLPR